MGMTMTQKILASHANLKEVKKGQNFTQKIIKSGRTVSDLLDTGTKLYNNVAKIYNSTENGRTNPVPLINGDGNKQKNKK